MQVLPEQLRSQVESALGRSITSAVAAEGGCTPAIRLRIGLDDGTRAFVKAATHEHTVDALHKERRIYDHVDAPFLPRVLAWAGDEQAPVLVLEDLGEAHWPPPWTHRQVQQASETLDAIHATAPPPDCPPAANVRDELLGWERLADDPSPFLGLGVASADWLRASLGRLRDAARAVSFDGGDLLHFDVRSDNLCLRDDQAIFVDWNWACVGNGAIDRAFWMPSLATEGGPRPDAVMPDAPECAALVAGYFCSQAGLPAIAHAPKVRPLQRRQMSAALPWAVRALALPPLDGPTPV